MGKKRPERTARRVEERAARQLVRDKEKLAALVAGGSAARPLDVPSSSVIEGRVRARSVRVSSTCSIIARSRRCVPSMQSAGSVARRARCIFGS